MTVAPGAPAPAFELPSDDGRTIALRDLTTGRSTVLAFFKTTCPTCRLAFPVFAELARRYGDAVPVVAVGQDPPAKARPWLVELGFGGPLLDDATGDFAVSAAFELRAVPTAVLVGPEGAVQFVAEGWDRDAVNELARRLGEESGRDQSPVSTEGDGLPPYKPG